MNNLVKVIDDFVEEDYFNQIQSTVTGDWQQWYYQSNLVGEYWGAGGLGKHGFNCWIIQQPNNFVDSYVAGLMTPLLQEMVQACECKNILRSRLDMTLYSPLDNTCPAHVDEVIPHIATVFYFNDSDGNTVIYNEKFDKDKGLPEDLTIQKEVEPKANRLVLFDGSYIHTGHTPREHNNRIVLNTNLS